ncbi:MAG: copper chaperone PCu(A)C [Sphingomonas sp.]
MTHRFALPLIMACASLSLPAAAQDVRKGDITISQPWSRATAPRAAVGAGYAQIRNGGKTADRLISVSTPRAARVELHSMTTQNGIMRMRPLSGGIALAPGATVALAPGGNHIMFMGLTAPLKQGERVPAALRFAKAGEVKVVFTVRAAGAAAPAHPHGGHQ